MEQPGPEPLEQLALPEDDGGLAPNAPRDVTRPINPRRGLQQPNEEPRPDEEQRSADRDRGGQRQRGDRRGYVPLAFLISAEIAGTTSCRSPITP